MQSTTQHLPVLKNELLQILMPNKGSICLDATFGAGGHTHALLSAVGRQGLVIALDRDEEALSVGRKIFAAELAAKRLLLVHTPFSCLKQVAVTLGLVGKITSICADLGVSTAQMLTPARGFSFQYDTPLDMRMSRDKQTITAADLINHRSAEELAEIFFTWGEERYARRLARRIVQARPFTSAKALATLIARTLPSAPQRHPATKVFQALRIAVNAELDELQTMLHDSMELLTTDGRLAVISFHSLEDRIVKQYMRLQAGKRVGLLPVADKRGEILKPFPIQPQAEEIYNNRRARSAKLRAIRKI